MKVRVEGRVVRTSRSGPVAGSSIVVAAGMGAEPDIAAEADAAGRFSLGGLAPGPHTFRAYAPDGATGETSLNVPFSGADIVIRVDEDDLSTLEEDGEAAEDDGGGLDGAPALPDEDRSKRRASKARQLRRLENDIIALRKAMAEAMAEISRLLEVIRESNP